ncbi:MAG: ethanolamine ammonia-lyase reactivating factor EutA [Planctomycetaceae bacterium]
MTAARLATVVGLDFGTTTSAALVGEAEIRRHAVTGRMELASPREVFRSPLVFTPLDGDRLDLAAAERLLDAWLAAGEVDPARLVGGGALLTGLTARRDNAAGLVAAVRRRLGSALVATADDPCLESWVAFQGACAPLSRRHAGRWFVHADIGGGTANLALGRDGEATATGSLFVGARHLRLEPGTRRVAALSPQAEALAAALGIDAAPGAEIAEADVARFVGWQADCLARAVDGLPLGSDPVAAIHEQVPFRPRVAPGSLADAALSLSGGVGEVAYALAGGDPRAAPPDGPAPWGDLGVELARAILAHPRLGPRMRGVRPEAGGRATVIGLMLHAVHLSGTSLHLPDPALLPLADLPIVGSFTPADPDDALEALLDLVRRSGRGGAVRVTGLGGGAAAVAACGARLARRLEAAPWPADRPLVLLLDADAGKALGACATRWGAIAVPLVVIDGLDLPDARFAALGRPHAGAVPVAFHGLRP